MKKLITLYFFLLAGFQLIAQTFYIAPDGSGNTFSRTDPGCIEDISGLLKNNPAKDVEILFMPGYYSLDQPIYLSNKELVNGRKVILKPFANGKVILGSGISVTKWKLFNRSKNIWVASISGQKHFRELYMDSTPAFRARYPNIENDNDGSPYLKTIDIDTETNRYRIKKEGLRPIGIKDGMEMIVQPHWYHNVLRIAESQAIEDTVLIAVKQPEADYAFLKHHTFYRNNSFHFENHFDFLDQAGEWFFDETTGQLFLVLTKGDHPEKHNIYIPGLETLLKVEGEKQEPARNLQIEKITFMHTKWEYPLKNGIVATQGVQPLGGKEIFDDGIRVPAAVSFNYCRNIELDQCTFSCLGAHGLIFVAGVQNSVINGCHFINIGADGIEIASDRIKFPDDMQVCAFDTIRNSTIEKVGCFYSSGQGILVSYARDIVIEHNEIRYCPYSGIQVGNQPGEYDYVGSRYNVIRRNHIHHVMQLHDDGGGIYTLSSQPGTIISENYLHDIRRSKWAQDAPVAAIYLDTAGQFIEISGNAIHDCYQNLYLQIRHRVKNNFIRDNEHLLEGIMKNAGPKLSN